MLQVFFRRVKPIICFVCELFAEQFRSGCRTTLSGSHLNSKQLLPSANTLAITQPLPLIFQLRWANTARKLLLPQAKTYENKAYYDLALFPVDNKYAQVQYLEKKKAI